jgi:hypothetical protein
MPVRENTLRVGSGVDVTGELSGSASKSVLAEDMEVFLAWLRRPVTLSSAFSPGWISKTNHFNRLESDGNTMVTG